MLGQIVNLYGRTEFERVEGKSPFVPVVGGGAMRLRDWSGFGLRVLIRSGIVMIWWRRSLICRSCVQHIHFPMQSGSDRILKLMRRPYKNEKFLTICEKMKAARPDLAITTRYYCGVSGGDGGGFSGDGGLCEAD